MQVLNNRRPTNKTPFKNVKLGEVFIVNGGEVYIKTDLPDETKGFTVIRARDGERARMFNTDIVELVDAILEIA